MKVQTPYPFKAIVGQENMKLALVLNIIDPGLGGVLIRGEKGTAKSTAVRALAGLMPHRPSVKGCPFGCDPQDEAALCDSCAQKKGAFETELVPMRVVELPLSAGEDRVVGTLDIERALKTGEKRFEPGLLASANRGMLYVDEVNLLDDHIVDLLLDSAAMGVNTVEREGISYSHPARFALIGTMNPEEGDLRPQLLDRFGLVADVRGEESEANRIEVVRRRLRYEDDPDGFSLAWAEKEKALTEQILRAQEKLKTVSCPDALLVLAAKISIRLEVDGHRADIGMIKTARALAAFEGRNVVEEADFKRAARYVLPHRMRRTPFEQGMLAGETIDHLVEEALNEAQGR